MIKTKQTPLSSLGYAEQAKEIWEQAVAYSVPSPLSPKYMFARDADELHARITVLTKAMVALPTKEDRLVVYNMLQDIIPNAEAIDQGLS